MKLACLQSVPLVLWRSILLDFLVSHFVKQVLLFAPIVEQNTFIRVNDQLGWVFALVSLIHELLKLLLRNSGLLFPQLLFVISVKLYASLHLQLLLLELQFFQLFLYIRDGFGTIVPLWNLAMVLIVVTVVVCVEHVVFNRLGVLS